MSKQGKSRKVEKWKENESGMKQEEGGGEKHKDGAAVSNSEDFSDCYWGSELLTDSWCCCWIICGNNVPGLWSPGAVFLILPCVLKIDAQC